MYRLLRLEPSKLKFYKGVEKTTSGICTTSTGVNYLGNTSITTGQNLSAGFIPIGLLPFLMNEEQQ